MDNNILSALKAIEVSKLTRAESIAVGMALKEEGYPCSVWDEWSRNDTRYKPGECERKWAGFNGTGNPVKGGTIVQMAKDLHADGIVDVALQFCTLYEMESFAVEKAAEEAGIPFMHITTDYAGEDAGQLQTRIEAFLETI